MQKYKRAALSLTDHVSSLVSSLACLMQIFKSVVLVAKLSIS